MASPVRYLPLIIGFGLLMENIDISIINTAIPKMALSLNTNPIDLKIGVTSYLLTLAAFIPISGYLADSYGAKRTFFWAIVVFLLGSIACGFSQSVWQLVLGRLVQGMGGAMMTPVGRLIMLRKYPKKEFIKAFGSLIILGQVGPALGPVLGGVLTTFYSWRYVFFVNVPFGLLALVLVHYFVEETPIRKMPKFDYQGFVLFGLAAAALTFGFSLWAEQEGDWPVAVSLLVMGIVLASLFYLHARHNPHPSLNLKVFATRSFRIAVSGSFIIRLALGGVPFLLPLLLQLGWHKTPLVAALLILPYGLSMFLAKPLVRKILDRYGYRKVLMMNPVILALIFSLLALSVHTYSMLFILILAGFLGFFSSLQFTFMNTLNFVDIEEDHTVQAVGISSVFQQISMSFGVCVVAFLLMGFGGAHYVANVSIPDAAFEAASLGLSFICLISILIFRNLTK